MFEVWKKASKNYSWNHFLALSSCVILGCYVVGFLLSYRFSFLPGWSDEYLYYMNAYSFFKTSSLKALFTEHGGSLWSQADVHGLFYPLMYGGISKVIGWHKYNFIIINFCWLIPGIILMYISLENDREKFLQGLFLLFSYPFLIFYAFGYMVETIHLAVYFFIGWVLINHNKKNYIPIFYVTLFIAGLFRPVWFMFCIAGMVFAENKKSFLYHVMTNLFFLFFTVFYYHYFIESTSQSTIYHNIEDLYNFNPLTLISAFYHSFFEQAITYFSFYHKDTSLFFALIDFLLKYFVFITYCYVIYRSIELKNNRYFWSLTLIYSIAYLLVFCTFQTITFRWKVLAGLPLMLIPSLLENTQNKVFRTTYLSIFVLFILFYIQSLDFIFLKNQPLNSAKHIKLNQESLAIANMVETDSHVLLDFFPPNYDPAILSLPIANSQGSPIRYFMYWSNPNEIANKFNYVLTEHKKDIAKVSCANCKKIMSGNQYDLYKVG